jgi:hypothetical protein
VSEKIVPSFDLDCELNPKKKVFYRTPQKGSSRVFKERTFSCETFFHCTELKTRFSVEGSFLGNTGRTFLRVSVKYLFLDCTGWLSLNFAFDLEYCNPDHNRQLVKSQLFKVFFYYFKTGIYYHRHRRIGIKTDWIMIVGFLQYVQENTCWFCPYRL